MNEVLECSRSTKTARNVLLVIGEVAHHDGVGWLPQGPPKDRPADRRSIAERANAGVRSVERAIAQLQELDELEVRRVQNSRKRLAVYRVIVGRLRDVEVDMDRLEHFAFDGPFWTVEELVLDRAIRLASGVATTRHFGGSSEGARPAISGSDDPPFLAAHACASEQTVLRTVQQQQQEERSDALAALGDEAVLAELEERLQAVGAGGRLRKSAVADPCRALAWLQLAADEAHTNPAGFVAVGMTSGDWPSRRGPLVSASSKQAWVESTSALLDPEEAHRIVDEWENLDDGERAQWHQAVDEARELAEQARRAAWRAA